MNYDRRTLLRVSGVTAAGALAGCFGDSDGTGSNNDGSTSEDGDQNSSTEVTNDDAPPGADILGGPNDLQSSATVEALALDADQGAGQMVFSPAVVWLQAGATATFENVSGSHSVTAYHPDNDKPQRVPDAGSSFDSGVMSEGDTFEHTFQEPGVYNYHCTPHEGLGMVGLVVVEESTDGPGSTTPDDVESAAARENLARLLDLAGIGGGDSGTSGYAWADATWDSYWYSLYNMSTNIAMSGNGITFPATDAQQETFQDRFPEMLAAADQPGPPVKNPNLNMAPFTTGEPSFTQAPVLEGDDGRPDASTLQWDVSNSSGIVSPSSIAWTHLKGVTWAKNFESHFDVLPDDIAAEFRSMLLATLAQVGTAFAFVPEQGGNLRLNDENLLVASEFQPGEGIVDETPRPRHHSAMVWFLSGLNSLAQNGWFGYENPEPLIPPENVQMLTNGAGMTTMNAFAPDEISNTRLAGELLGAMGWFGTQTDNRQLRDGAVDYANGLASQIEANLDGNGRVDGGAANQAATQGVVGQGLVWASQLDGVDHTETAESVIGYLVDELYDGDAGTFASGPKDDTYQITARDAGDITGGINAAEAVLGMDVTEQYAQFFDQTFNRGRLQRAERPPSRDESAEYTLPLPPAAGGEFGQAAVYNAAVEYDTGANEWSVVDDSFDTEAALYLSNQEVWISHWGGDFYPGRGVPGESETPP